MAIDLFYPHPQYDWKATERWLEKKARKGWRLIPGGNLNDLAAFERAEPTEIRYRLVPTGKTGLTRPDDDPPNADALELYRQMGWEYVTTRGAFHIFRTETPCAPEPDTDPQVLAMALKPTVKRAIWDSLGWLLFVSVQIVFHTPFYLAVWENDPLWLLLYLPLAVTALSRLFSCLRLIRYRRVCSKGRFPDVRRRLYLPDNFLLAACLMLALVGFFAPQTAPPAPPSQRYDDYVLYEDYEWPFTIPGAVVEKTDAVSYTTFATRENWGYDGYIVMPDGSQDDIYIDYADFHSGLLAKWYAWELQRNRKNDLILQHGTEVYRINTNITIEDPEAVFFPKKE